MYQDNLDPESLLWDPETPATSNTYKEFLSQFLPAFREFLESEGLIERSFFHVSDEPGRDEHLHNYRKARAMLRELAPWMKVSDAVSEVEYAKEGLMDIPITILSADSTFSDEGIPHWVYYCCMPRGKYLNRFLDTPLTKIRMSGWLFYRLRAEGFLHWGYNYWQKKLKWELVDPFTETAAGVWGSHGAYGNPFVVYPGSNGPIDSIRWEVFAESLQDYALLQSAGISPDDKLLEEIKAYDDFPWSEGWISEASEKIMMSCCPA